MTNKLDYLSEFVSDVLRGIMTGIEKAKEAGIPARAQREVKFRIEISGYEAEFAVEIDSAKDWPEDEPGELRVGAENTLDNPVSNTILYTYSMPSDDNITVTSGTA